MNKVTFAAPAFIAIGALTAPQLLAQMPASQPQCAVADNAAAARAAQSAGRRRALMGFARTLAGNLPMLGRGAGIGAVSSIVGQTAQAALSGQANAIPASAGTVQACDPA